MRILLLICFLLGQVLSVDHDQVLKIQFYGNNLHDLLLEIAQRKNINIILPAGIDALNNIVINFSTPHEITLLEAEELLLNFLSMAGYMLAVQDNIFIVLRKNDATLMRSPLPLYIDVDPRKLPDNAQHIRVLYFLKNIRLQDDQGRGSMTVSQILTSFLPDGAKGITIDTKSNGLFLSGPANAIAAAMTLIKELDNYGVRDEIFVLPLFHTSASVVAKLIEDIILVAKDTAPAQISVIHSAGAYFSPYTKVIPEVRTNSLLFIGKKASIEKLVSFIRTDVDVPQDTGRSVVHVKNLRFLDAKKIAPVLQSIVSGKTQSGQSIQGSSFSSTHRTFDGVRIIAEESTPTQTNSSQGAKPGHLTLGGNRLIIAATNDDFKEIDKIIDQLDKPQSQIIIEVMVLDMSIQQMNMLGSQLRLPGFVTPPAGVGFQSIMLAGTDAIFNDSSNPSTAVGTGSGPQFSPQTTINSDLLSAVTSKDSNVASTIVDNRKGLIISVGEEYKNQGIAAILQIQNVLNIRNVVQQPYIVTQNNRRTEIQDLNIRRAEGGLSANSSQYGGATVVNIEPYPTKLSISITPRINNIQEYENQEQPQLSLELELSVDAWKIANDPNNLDKITRTIRTSANVGSGDLLVLGGLYGQTTEKRIAKTPLLGDIPLIGGLFKSTQVDTVDSNLVVIIRATAAEPRKDTLGRYTAYHADIAEELMGKDNIFGGHKDSAMRFSINPDVKSVSIKQEPQWASKQAISIHYSKDESPKETSIEEDDRYKKIKESLKNFDKIKL